MRTTARSLFRHGNHLSHIAPKDRGLDPRTIKTLSNEDLSELWYSAAIGDESRDEGWFYDNEESPVRLRQALEKLFAWDGSTTGSAPRGTPEDP